MTENLADSDIDKFIRDQKSRLALEKRELNDEEEYQRTTRKRWAEPDKENFNFGDKKEPDTRPDLLRPETPVRQGYPLDNRQVIKQRKQLSEQRKHEYNDYLKSHTNNRRKPRNLTPTQKSIQVGNPNDRRKEELNTERRNDYNEHLNREKSARDSPERLLIPDNLTKEKAEKLRRERQHDYQEMMAQNQQNKENMRSQQNGGMKSQGSGRRMWKEDSSLDFFGSNRPEPSRVPADKFNEFTKSSRRTPAEQNGYVPSQMQNKPKAEPMPVGGHRVDEERRQEYQEMLKSKSTPRSRRYNENDTDEFMSNKYDKPKVHGKDNLEDFIKSGPNPSPRAEPSNQTPVQSPPTNQNQNPDMERKEEYNNLMKNSSKPKKLYKEPSKDDFFDFDRIQRNNPSEKRPRERAPVNEEMKREYNENMKNNPKPILKPYRENSSDDFLKHGGPQRRVNNNSTRVPTSETFHNQEKEYQAKVKGGQTPRRRTWREPTNDNFFATTDKYQQAPKKSSSGSDYL